MQNMKEIDYLLLIICGTIVGLIIPIAVVLLM
jgi:hypothetical protein